MMADEGAGGLETAARPVTASGAQEAGGRGYSDPAARPGTALPAREGREAASAATGLSPENGLFGDGAPETCGAEGWEARAGAGGKAEEVTTGEGAIFMEDAEREVGKQHVGKEMEVAEKLVRGEKLEVGEEAQQSPGPLNFGGPVVDPLEAIQWELEA